MRERISLFRLFSPSFFIPLFPFFSAFFLSSFLSVLCSFLVFVYPVLSVISVLCSWLGRPENAHSFGRTSHRHSVFLCIVYHVHWCFAGLDMYHLDKDNAWLREVKSQMASVGVLNRCWLYVEFMLNRCEVCVDFLWIVYVGSMLTRCWIRAEYVLNLCGLYDGFMLIRCWIDVEYVLNLCGLYVEFMWIICRIE